MFDSHIHSTFSTDSTMNAEQACKRAYEMGLEGLIFTDHVDFDYPGPDGEFMIDLSEHGTYFEALKEKWNGRLKVLKGIEMGFQPHIIPQITQTIQQHKFDYVIGSVHIIDKKDPYTGDFFTGLTQRQAYSRYLEEIICCLREYSDFDSVGHIGYAARYGKYEDRLMRYSEYNDLLDEIIKLAIEKGKAIEINTSGLRSDLNTTIPGYDFFKRYKELGGELVTIGSDSHKVEHLGADFDEVAEHLKSIGFKYITHFENRKLIFTGI